MLRYLIMCKSLTYAQRASKALERYGITASIARLPQSVAGEGCTYCVRINENKLSTALEILRKSALPPGRIFLTTEDGKIREVKK